MINGKYKTNDDVIILLSYTPGQILSFKYAPKTSCNVERKLSRRSSFIFVSLKPLIITTHNFTANDIVLL